MPVNSRTYAAGWYTLRKRRRRKIARVSRERGMRPTFFFTTLFLIFTILSRKARLPRDTDSVIREYMRNGVSPHEGGESCADKKTKCDKSAIRSTLREACTHKPPPPPPPRPFSIPRYLFYESVCGCDVHFSHRFRDLNRK